MTDISRRLQRVLAKTQKDLIKNNQILPQKVEGGILVGDVLIISDGSIKNLWQQGDLKYRSIYLNNVAIRLANLLACRKYTKELDNLYNADQEYGRWFVDSQILRTQYQKALNSQNYDRADIYWARYVESRDRALQAKSRAEALAAI